jgi:outer membrane lipoprotein SlyB
MKTLNIIIAVSIATLLLGGCMPTSNSGSIYTRDQARQVQEVESGVIESVRNVQIEGTQSGVGTVGGAVIGAIASSGVGGGRGRSIATTAGAIAGGLLGSALEEGTTRKDALEITVRLDSGKSLSVVQEADVPFQAGERVHVLTSPTATRVSR